MKFFLTVAALNVLALASGDKYDYDQGELIC